MVDINFMVYTGNYSHSQHVDVSKMKKDVEFTALCHQISTKYGIKLTDDEALQFLWDETGYPSFWATGQPITDCTRDLHNAFYRMWEGKTRNHNWTPNPLVLISKVTS